MPRACAKRAMPVKRVRGDAADAAIDERRTLRRRA
jgi:hypothetical protein